MCCNHPRVMELLKAGEWDEAHEAVQPYSDKLSCLIHACLHRLEGDVSNAQYWYRRAGEMMPDNSIEQEIIRLESCARK